jgi:HTH-type transcriptional regulator, competence development regulator
LTNVVKYKYSNLKTTGEILREERERQGLLLRQVAALLDMDTAILSKVERGERKPTREQIVKIADVLKLNKNGLLIQYLSEKIAYEIADEEIASEALKAAEERVEYIRKKKKRK